MSFATVAPVKAGSGSLRGGLGVLNGMSDEDIDWILQASEERAIGPGTVILNEGIRAGFIFFIARGLLSVFLGSDSTGRLNTLGPGQIVGEMSFIEGRPASASVMALEDSIVLALSMDALNTRLNANPPFAARLFRSFAVMTSARLRELLGLVSRWVQEAPPPALLASEASRRLAERTQQFKEQLRAFEKGGMDPAKVPELADALGAFSAVFDEIAGPGSPELLDVREELGARVQRELLPFLLKGPLAERLFFKPRGFAWDFETLELLYRGKANPPVDRLVSSLPGIVALRERNDLMARLARRFVANNEGASVAAVVADGAGDAAEALIVAVPPERLRLTLVDFDAAALKALAKRCESVAAGAELHPVNPHFLSLVSGRFGDLGEQRLFVSTGLADLLEDAFLLRFLNGVHASLAAGGAILAGFCNAAHPDRTFLRYVLNSETVYRTEEQVRTLFRRSRFGEAAVEIEFTPNRGAFAASVRKQG